MSFDNTGLRRRRLIQGAAAAAALPGFYIGSAAAQQTLKIGMVIAKQGPFAQQGGDLAKGVQIAFDEAGAKVLGRPAELMWLDEANPQGAVQNITKLIEEEKAIAVLGGTSSATSLAMGSVALRARVPFISVNGAAREITGKDCNPFMFRAPASVPVYAQAMADQMLAVGKKWYFIVGSFAFGEDVVSTFSEVLKARGGTVVGVDRTPVATTDYSSFVLKARAAKPDVVISGAANVEPLLKQFKELGLTGNIAIAGPAVSDTDLWSASPDALAGIFGKSWYYNDPNNSPAEKAFVAAYRAKEGKPPSDRVFFGWHSMKLLLAAAQQGNSTEPIRLTKALEEVRVPDGANSVLFRKGDHQLLRRLVVGTAHKPNPADKWDVVDVKSSAPANQEALEKLYGDPVQLGCKMAPIA
ncbi:ABC transporter substrate-binding protein [Variovorax sp. 770b2]|uniref:ABC transporter substrate-binding protein n=1 Tax=Variovorax sp. 770b2 TaxID=1566271 RepID=UPI0008EF95D7|nr:ABC transporter substrate-binding protein [Variovorax sp. 770b2]SFP26859.1 branched-chain amino acid transport system substrate-binding protein [Variovorax sp. 770b2]